ncbi:MAG: ribbon-helix-helix protein, CopG family [Lachnospiraceae bacterium]|nr:ribbon-helix-helix protein, CopG family [Lachnospiraceae bacterium]
MATKKVGRPTDNVKDFMLRTRMDKETVDKLEYLSKELKLSKSEIVRRGINKQYKEIKK